MIKAKSQNAIFPHDRKNQGRRKDFSCNSLERVLASSTTNKAEGMFLHLRR
jgi:hypothetical protein